MSLSNDVRRLDFEIMEDPSTPAVDTRAKDAEQDARKESEQRARIQKRADRLRMMLEGEEGGVVGNQDFPFSCGTGLGREAAGPETRSQVTFAHF